MIDAFLDLISLFIKYCFLNNFIFAILELTPKLK